MYCFYDGLARMALLGVTKLDTSIIELHNTIIQKCSEYRNLTSECTHEFSALCTYADVLAVTKWYRYY